MRKLLLLLFAFLLPAPVFAAITQVAETCATQIGGGDGSDLTSSSINTTGADLIIIFYTYYDSGGSPSIPLTDTHTGCASSCNTFHPLTQLSIHQNSSRIAYAWNASGGTSHTFTESAGGGLYNGTFCVVAYSGSQTSSDPFDKEDSNYAFTGNTLQPGGSGTFTPTAANSLVVTGINVTQQNNPLTISGGSFSIVDQIGPGTDKLSAYAQVIQTAITGVNPTWGTDGVGDSQANIAAFKAAVAGPARRPGHAMVLQ